MTAAVQLELKSVDNIEPVIGEAEVDAAIETCGGDMRNTILSLLLSLESARREAS